MPHRCAASTGMVAVLAPLLWWRLRRAEPGVGTGVSFVRTG
ncbi:hypothetical protein [Actinopolyspora erythraea]|nr:hypothetical protein [Actinopolyspora erythraea]